MSFKNKVKPDGKPGPKKRILVVDDEYVTRTYLQKLLEKAGHAVDLAGNGQEALDLLQQSPLPDLILLDLIMEGMDGWEFRERQRQNPALAYIPVLIITALKESDIAAHGGEHLQYLSKPIDSERLLDAVERLAKTGRNRRRSARIPWKYSRQYSLRAVNGSCSGTLIDVSSTGCGLNLSCYFKPGTRLILQRENDPARPIHLEVKHAQEIGPSHWNVGCSILD